MVNLRIDTLPPERDKATAHLRRITRPRSVCSGSKIVFLFTGKVGERGELGSRGQRGNSGQSGIQGPPGMDVRRMKVTTLHVSAHTP